MNLVGIEEHIKRTESLLCMESQEVRIIGIWGMGGIGKTTIARAVFDRICNQFKGFHFLANVRENLRSYTAVDLRNKLLSKILDEDKIYLSSLQVWQLLLQRIVSAAKRFLLSWMMWITRGNCRSCHLGCMICLAQEAKSL
jgi:hypothetical protein